jgi:uncharacterized protein (DUF983 family)
MNKWIHYARVMLTGMLLRCPHCKQPGIAAGLFKINKTCPHCGVRFERQSGESVGAMYFNLGIAELTSLGGFFIASAVFNPPFLPHALFWVTYNILFCILFYRHSRGLWIGINYLTGGVYRDALPVEEAESTVDSGLPVSEAKDTRL